MHLLLLIQFVRVHSTTPTKSSGHAPSNKPTPLPTSAIPPVGRLAKFGNVLGLNETLHGLSVGSSLALSFDGQILAVNAQENFPYSKDMSGKVLVYQFNSSTKLWMPYGSPLHGPNNFGNQLALSHDGKVLAVTTLSLTPNETSGVQVFHFESNEWTQRGTALQVSYNEFKSVALSSNGTILAIGSAAFGGGGRVDVYQWSAGSWRRFGQQLDGGGSPFLAWGFMVTLSADGNTLASSGRVNGGAVSVFRRNTRGMWVAFGKDILCQYGTHTSSDFCVGDGTSTLSANGLRVSVSFTRETLTQYHNELIPNFTKGFRVFDYNTTLQDWQQVGPSVNGSGLELGVSMSDAGTRIAVNGHEYGGYARVYYSYQNPTWHQQNGSGNSLSTQWIQVGQDLKTGRHVALSGDGNTLAVSYELNVNVSYVVTYRVMV